MRSLSSKMLASVLIILGTAFISIGFFLYSMNYSLIKNIAIANLDSSLKSIASSAGYFLRDIYAYKTNFIMNDIISESLDNPLPGNKGAEIVLIARIQQYLLLNRINKPYLTDIALEGENGLFAVSVPQAVPNTIFNDIIKPSWKESKRESDWFLLKPSQTLWINYSKEKALMNRQNIYSYKSSYRKIGTAYFIINTEALDDILKGMPLDFCDYYIIDNATNQVLSASDISDGAQFIKNPDEKYFTVSIQSYDSNWSVVGRVYDYKIRQRAMEDLKPILLVCFILLVSAGIAVEIYVYFQTNSIKKLEKAMIKVSKGDLDVKAEIHSKDEIQRLAEIFNNMIVKIKGLISDVEKENSAKKNFQLKALMMQINPHFIYNTLNCVIYLSHAKRNDDVIQLSRCFISLLRETIHWENGFNTINKELKYLDDYVSIQKIRYGNNFSVEYDLNPSILERTMPRMILQPLVENSIFHGILKREDASEPGLIKISVTPSKEGGILFNISDNGAGSELESFYHSRIESYDKMSGIGVPNVRERLKALYGTDITIHSVLGEGTNIQFVISDLKEGDTYDPGTISG